MSRLKVKLPPKWKLTSILAISFSISFTVLLFMPLDMYLHNPGVFIVSWKFLLPGLLLFSFTGFIALSIVNIALWQKSAVPGVVLLLLCGVVVIVLRLKFDLFPKAAINILSTIAVAAVTWVIAKKILKEKASDVVMLIMVGVLLSSYIQVLFLNGGMVKITGASTGYDALTLRNLANFCIWLLVAVLPIGVWFTFRLHKKGFNLDKSIVFSALLISVMQIAGIISTSVSAELPIGLDEDENLQFSYASAIEFSPENNIIVFILDRLDVEYFRETLEEHPELNNQLDGFTFYENNVSGYIQTFPSVPSMLTQYDYSIGSTFSEYWDEAWARQNAIDTLRENGFKTNLYLDRPSTYDYIGHIKDRTDNLMFIAEVVLDYEVLFGTTARLSLGRMAPYLLKDRFLETIPSAFGYGFFSFTDEETLPEIMPPVVCIERDIKFYDYIMQATFLLDSKKDVFTLMHLNAGHAEDEKGLYLLGYRFDPQHGMKPYDGDYMDSIRACFEIMNVYFTKMKEIGVYDKSTIILMGDHGAMRDYATTALLIKPTGASGSLRIDSQAELSNKYFGASILELAGIEHRELGVSYYDIIGGATPPERIVTVYTDWWDEKDKTRKVELHSQYSIIGDSNNKDNWIQIE